MKSETLPEMSERAPLLRLDHASVMTAHLERTVSFYTNVLGLNLRCIEADPIRRGRRRAMLTDESGRDVVELIEMTELSHAAIPGRGGLHHLGFRLTHQDWQALKQKWETQGYPFQEVGERLFARDPDGLVLEIEHENPRKD